MRNTNDQRARCAAMVRQVNDELGWQMSQELQAAYVSQLLTYFPDNCSDSQLRQMVSSYHMDHELVQALGASEPAVWNDWTSQVVAILRSAGLTWSTDRAIDSDDLVQTARLELFRALPTFRYASRFSTWAYQVIVQSVKRTLRDSQAQKRAGRPDSLEHLPDSDAPVSRGDDLETQTETQLLIERITTILAAQADRRLASIFHLWAVQDLQVVEIGKLVQLHPSRVRALLTQARAVLQEHPDMQSWNKEAKI